jgi:hypothetical protein
MKVYLEQENDDVTMSRRTSKAKNTGQRTEWPEKETM